MIQDAFWGILIPFLGTSLGAGCVFFLKKSLRDGIQRALTGFAAGVMVAASVSVISKNFSAPVSGLVTYKLEHKKTPCKIFSLVGCFIYSIL